MSDKEVVFGEILGRDDFLAVGAREGEVKRRSGGFNFFVFSLGNVHILLLISNVLF
jgi:hypothetical protein